jgi:hypothetical protein
MPLPRVLQQRLHLWQGFSQTGAHGFSHTGAHAFTWHGFRQRTFSQGPQAVIGGELVTALRAPCLLVTRAMVEGAYFAGRAHHGASVDSLMHHLALKAEGKLLRADVVQVIVCDDDGDRAMSLRMKAIHQADIAAWSRRLNISRNDFVLRCIEHYAAYLSELEERKEEE